MQEDFLSRAEAMFMDAASDPDGWRAAMDSVVQHTGSLGAALMTVEGRGPFIIATAGVAELADQYVKDGWYLRDFRYAALPRLRTVGIFTDQDITTLEDMRKNPYYADYLMRKGAGWGAGIRIDTGDDMWCLTLQRGVDKGAYQKEEQQRLLPLIGIVNRAAALARRLEFARLDGAADASTVVGGACLFIDRFGRIAKMNEAAEAMVGRQFLISQGRIAFAHTSSERLDRHIDAAIWPNLAADDTAMQPVVVQQESGRPLVFHALRLRGRAQGLFAPAYALLLVTDLNMERSPRLKQLQAVFQFTGAEARLAYALLQQFNLVDAAAKVNCSHETARKQIKSIFEKTRTSNQAELVNLLSKLTVGNLDRADT